jgi:hypothetical protein
VSFPTALGIQADIGEKHEVSAAYPEVVERMLALAGIARLEIGDLDRLPATQRPAGQVIEPKPQVLQSR